MKQIRNILLCCTVFLFTSCIREGLIECPPAANLQLTFSYTGDTNDPSMFGRCIDQVMLMVYDENERLILSRDIDKNELTKRQGVELELSSGNYTIVCWANAREYTQLYHCELFSVGRLHHPYLLSNAKISTNSHLYYGSYAVTMPDYGQVSGDIPFHGAHINMEVYVRSAEPMGASEEWPRVEARNLMPQYNMEMQPTMAYATTYYPETSYNTERKLTQTLFEVFNFQDDNPIYIEIKNQTGEVECNIELRKYMADNNISVSGKNEATVPILIEYTDLGTEVKLPEWIVNEVNPGTR